jgi:capsular polysaccharide transport system permease protein
MMLRARSFSSAASARPLPPANDGGPLVPLTAPLPAVGFLPPRLAVVVPDIARRKWSLRWVSFVALVVVPVLAAAVYYFAFAADQYVSEFRLSVHKSEAANPMPAWLLDTGGAPGVASLESHVLVQYITSRAIVDDLDRSIALRPVFAAPEADWWARLRLPASVERLVEYWRGQVDAFYEPSNGTVTVRVRAFTADAALQLAQAIVGAAERLVNELSVRARHDALRQSQTEVAEAEKRLAAALAQIREFRDREGLIDPGKTADATASLAARLRDEIVRGNAELSTLKTYMRDDAPSVRVLKARIRSLEEQQRVAAQELTDGKKTRPDALSRVLGTYEQLESERKFAETAYQHALAALDRARGNADRQQVYIASFVPPSLAEEALYPRRWRSLGLVALLAFALWAIGGLAVQSIRDHV